MITVFVHRDGATRQAERVDPAWLAPQAPETVWVDLEAPAAPELAILTDVFKFHELAVEDAMDEIHHPKIESYEGFLYLILHGIQAKKRKGGFETHDIDFFLGRNFLVSVHRHQSRSVEALRMLCSRHGHVIGEGPPALLHRIVDQMVDHYGPEVDTLETRLERIEGQVFSAPNRNPLRDILGLKADVASLRRVTTPQRDAIARLARREFPQISDAMTYRFRDVYDQLVRLTDEAIFMQDRVTGLLDAHLSMQSNRLNQVMKVLTVIATIFMPLTVLTGMYGMNVHLPNFPGGVSLQFWWVAGIMVGLSAVMLWVFRRMDWL
jgi:magnesium transporter